MYKNSPKNITPKIKINTNETIFKVSMSSKDIMEKDFRYFSDNNLVVVHKATPAKGTSSQSQGDTFSKQMKIGDYFYLCRGNSNLEVIGKITGEAEPCSHNDLGHKGWLQRSYDIITKTEKEGPIVAKKNGGHPTTIQLVLQFRLVKLRTRIKKYLHLFST